EDGVVRPLLSIWREDARRYCETEGLSYRDDTSNRDTVRGLIREQILPLLRRIHPAADENLLRALDERETLPPALADLLASPTASRAGRRGGGSTGAGERRGFASTTASGSSSRLSTSTARCAGGPGALRHLCRALRYGRGVPATGSPGARRRSRTCSSTRRSRAPRESNGPSSYGATRPWPSPGPST